jgi:hypothetical protein
MFDTLLLGVAHCRAVVVDHGDLMLSLLMAGLLGSATHCVGMCGPLVAAQVMARLEARPAATMRESDRWLGAALVPYHLGRMTTYVALGSIAGALAGGVIDVTGLRWLSAALLAAAAVVFLGYALDRFGIGLPRLAGGEGWWSRQVGRRLRPLFDRPVGWRGYALGVALGFLPCGLLYGALAAAAAGGDAIAGAVAMAAFTLGTVPALLAVGMAGHVVGRQWRPAVARAVPFLLIVNASVLSYIAWRMVA